MRTTGPGNARGKRNDAGAMTVAGDTATMRSYTCETYRRDGVTRRDFGEYADQCAKVDGCWYFVSRQFRPLHRSDADT